MFQALKNFFLGRNTPPSASDFEDQTPRPLSENPNFVTDPDHIIRILRGLEKERILFTVAMPHVAERFSTTLLEVHDDKGYLVLDELTPEIGHVCLQEKKHLTVHALLRGVNISFKLSDIETGREKGIAYYTAPLPDQVYYKQRRGGRRIVLKTEVPVPFQTTYGTAKIPVQGIVMDVSLGGIGIMLTNNVARIRQGDTLRKCRIVLPEDHEILFDLGLRSVRPHPNDVDKLFIGGCFENLEPRGQKHLERFMIAAERQEIRAEKD